MAGGKGVRLRPYTLKNPKPLMLIKHKISILENIIESCLKKWIQKHLYNYKLFIR